MLLSRVAQHVVGTAAPAAAAGPPPTKHVLPLDTDDDGLEVVGGKGRSLSRMSKVPTLPPVPGGFIATAAAYREYVAEYGLQDQILGLAGAPDIVDGMLSFEGASAKIGALFAANPLSPSLVAELEHAYGVYGGERPLAVRSSANAEDLPGLSFAGQHSSFLNVLGAAEVCAAVRDCWASLWTPQASKHNIYTQSSPQLIRMSDRHCGCDHSGVPSPERCRSRRRCDGGRRPADGALGRLRHHVHRQPRYGRALRDHHQRKLRLG